MKHISPFRKRVNIFERSYTTEIFTQAVYACPDLCGNLIKWKLNHCNDLAAPIIWTWRSRHGDMNPWEIASFTWCEKGLDQNCCFCSQNRCCHTSWHFCRVNSSTHHDMVLRPVANNWLLSDRVSQQWWQKIQQNRTGWSEDHYSQQIKAHEFHCLVCCYWIAQNSPYPIHNIRLVAKIKSRIPSLWQIACVVKTRLQLSPSHDFVILIITK